MAMHERCRTQRISWVVLGGRIAKKRHFWISGFTLVELIVVITILAILATVGFLSLSGYSDDARTATVKANVRTVYSAILTESTTSGNSPRYYVEHSSGAALSGAFVFVDGKSVALTGGDLGVGDSNYTAGNPRWDRLRMNGGKFRLAGAGAQGLPYAFGGFGAPGDEASAAYSTGELAVGAVDVFKTGANGRKRATPFFQVAALAPSAKTAVVAGNYSPGTGNADGLVRDPAAPDASYALADGAPSVASNPADCKAVKAASASAGDGAYRIDPDGAGGNPPFTAYCDMTTDGGGWTLAMKAASNGSVLGYDSPYWDGSDLLNPGSLDLSDADAKFAAFGQVPGARLRFCMDNGGWKCVTKDYAGTARDFAQLQTTAQVGYAALATSDANATAWIQGLGFSNASNIVILCNGHHAGNHTAVRIWVNANNSVSEGCNWSDDYAWGFWLRTTYGWSVQYASSWFATPQASKMRTQWAIYVR